MKEHNKQINRRDFLKIVGIATATTTASTFYGCGSKGGVTSDKKSLLLFLPIK